ncbi:unnamed protein product [Bemisia tabaci]|uniref:ATPase V1 complex subunit H C-terminal domain-containing protein n=1 Tax=Bemisia tabaci TaxID=7038 RepID=A0A9P0A3N7_BEMTA|nr:unnamed protein product [Bemisia tabaci]
MHDPIIAEEETLLTSSDGESEWRGLLFAGRCLQVVLRHHKYCLAFIKVGGPSTLLKVLASGQVNFQIQYQLMFCLRLLPFNPKFAQKMNKLGVIPILGDILSDFVTEKVTRIILAVFRKSRTLQTNIVSQWYRERKFDDEDIVEDIQFLYKKLQASVQDLSSFDATEVKCGRLEWSPVHRSAQFWGENAARLNEHNYELLRCLVYLLDTSEDALVLSIASFDVGEYGRHYSRGKQEYLGCQLEKEQGSTTTAAKSAAGVFAGKTSM